MRPVPLALACGLGAALAAAPAAAETFVIVPGAGSVVRFVSKAPMESFEGRTDRVSGRVEVDCAAPGDSATVEVSVELAGLETGIGLRDRHMRENHLETDRYPRAVFRGATLRGAPAALAAGAEPVACELSGSFELHGVTRPLRVPVRVGLREREGRRELVAEGRFPVALADFGIPRPQFLLLKLGDVQDVSFSLVATSAGRSGE